MKQFLILIAMIFTVSAFAQERILLTDKNNSVQGTDALLIRTNETPNNVVVSVSVPMANSVCEQYNTRYVLRTSGMHCGYNTQIRRINERVCVRSNERGACISFQNRTRTQTFQTPRMCSVPETYCAQYGTRTSYKTDTVKIQFKDLPKLGGSEEDTFSLSASQKSYDSSDVVFEIKPLETVRPYKVKQKKFLGLFAKDSFVVQER